LYDELLKLDDTNAVSAIGLQHFSFVIVLMV